MDLDEARVLATALMREHGLADWGLVLDHAKRRAGVCRFDRREIGLSRHLTALHDTATVRNTVLHEIAHALVGPGHGHDQVWQRTARQIGAAPAVTLDPSVPKVPGAWQGRCPAGHVHTRHRRPSVPISCGRCRPGFDVRHLVEWRRDGRLDPMLPGYALHLRRLVEAHGRTSVAVSDEALAIARAVPAPPRRPASAAGRRGGRPR